MVTMAGEGTSYDVGGGAGGKFRKRPFRRNQTTPYDRPQTALRNPRTSGWISKLVDPASKLISASAHLFFSSVFRKRLPPPPPPLPSPPPEANQESRDTFGEAVLDSPPGVQGLAVNDVGNPTNSFSCTGLSELEQILKQKTFTRAEIDRLTELLRSRTVDLPNGDVDKRTEFNLPHPVSDIGRQDGFASTPMQENKTGSHGFHECISTPVVSSQILEEDITAPAELAKAYMGSRPSKVSPSTLGLHSQALRENANLLNNGPFPPKSPVMSLVPRSAVRVGVSENGFTTARSRGRSAIYNMARTPYSSVHPTATQKDTSSTYDGYYGPSASSSSQFVWEHGGQYSSNSKQLALKRRSSVLEDNIGSVGPIRRLRQKTNLSTPKNLSLSISGSPFSSHRIGIGPDAVQYPISSAQKLPSLDECKHRISRTVGENADNSMPGTSYTPVPSKSTEMATKILQQLEKLVPMEKSSEGKVAAAREKSHSKLTPNMLREQAFRSLEGMDSSKILHNAENSIWLKDMNNISLPNARDTSSQKQDKIEENGPKRLIVSRDALAPAAISNTIVPVEEAVPGIKTADSVSSQFGTTPQKKWLFQMSAHEDFLELDDEIHFNKAASTLLADGKEKLETSVLEGKDVSCKAVTVEKTCAVSELKTLPGSVLKKSNDLRTSDGTIVGEKKTGFVLPSAPASGTTFQLVGASQSTSAFDKIVAPPPLYSFSPKNDDQIPSLTFSSSSCVSESSILKSGATFEPEPGRSSNSLANVSSGATGIVPKFSESDMGDNKNMQKSGVTMGKSEISFSSAPSTSQSTGHIFSFGAPASTSSLTNGLRESIPYVFSPSPFLASSNFTHQTFTNSLTNVASSTTAMATASNSSLSTSAAKLFPAASIFKFGSTSVAPTNAVPTVSITSIAETTDLQAKNEKETTLGNLASSPFGGTSFTNTGSTGFGFGSSSATTSADNLSQGSLFGTCSGSLVSKETSPAGTGVATVTQSVPIQFNSSVSSSPMIASSEITSFTPSSSLFGSSASKVIGSSTGFGLSSSSSSSETHSISSIGATSSLFGSSWQPTKSSIFGSTTVSPSTGFSLGASSISAAAATTNSAPMLFQSSVAASGSLFSFTSASATASSSQSRPVFGGPVPVFTTASGNGEQMNTEDSMAEDPVRASTPKIPVFGQPPISTPSSSFVFGSPAPSSGQPFQFGSQQNQSTPQNPPLFQASGSLDLGAGGSFSLGSGGDDKVGNRRIVKVKHKFRRR